MFHNPSAVVPLDESFLPNAAHHWFENGMIRSMIPPFHPYQSQTLILAPKRIGEGAYELGEESEFHKLVHSALFSAR